MKQVVHIIHKVDFEKQYIKGLMLELDYELSSLHDFIQQNETENIERSKHRLQELHMELSAFNAI